MFPLTASAAAYSFAVGTSESAVLQALRPPASTAIVIVKTSEARTSIFLTNQTNRSGLYISVALGNIYASIRRKLITYRYCVTNRSGYANASNLRGSTRRVLAIECRKGAIIRRGAINRS